jgi:hypothetical protein
MTSRIFYIWLSCSISVDNDLIQQIDLEILNWENATTYCAILLLLILFAAAFIPLSTLLFLQA